jgi:hypothetical protein
MRTARDAAYSDLEASRSIYDFVLDVCVSIGASRNELASFEKYAGAVDSLSRPASAARALNNGALVPRISLTHEHDVLQAPRRRRRSPRGAVTLGGFRGPERVLQACLSDQTGRQKLQFVHSNSSQMSSQLCLAFHRDGLCLLWALVSRSVSRTRTAFASVGLSQDCLADIAPEPFSLARPASLRFA